MVLNNQIPSFNQPQPQQGRGIDDILAWLGKNKQGIQSAAGNLGGVAGGLANVGIGLATGNPMEAIQGGVQAVKGVIDWKQAQHQRQMDALAAIRNR